MIVGTAGHIDHGKTALIKALTGVDTDRLEEEKRRGLTIDLGFAYKSLANGEVLGFVDVPGHERFIHNMLSGATGIDYVLLVVAADDGPMPQTREHLAILDLLDVERGLVAVTKADLVSHERVTDVCSEMRQLLRTTGLAGADALPVSVVSGLNIAELNERLTLAAAAAPPRSGAGRFRLAIDRAFTLSGAGVVVTGMVHSGAVHEGDRVVLSPSGIKVRVRGLHCQNQPARTGGRGQRCAINLTGPGVEKAVIRRGDWLLAEALHAPTSRLDARLRLLHGDGKAPRHRDAAQVHLGTDAIASRMAILDSDATAPGAKTLRVQLVLERAIPALRGDRFILRDPAAHRIIGGGSVIDPFPPARGRRKPERLRALDALELGSPRRALLASADNSALGVDRDRFALASNVDDGEMEAASAGLHRLDLRPGRHLLFAPARWAALLDGALEALRAYHSEHSEEPGIGADSWRKRLAARPDADVFAAMLHELLRQGRIERAGPLLRISGHRGHLTAREEGLWRRIRPLIAAGGLKPPRVHALSEQAKVNVKELRMLLQRVAREGEVYAVTPELHFMREVIVELAARTQHVCEAESTGILTVARFREGTGVSRNVMIELLEFFDRSGFTLRTDAGRKIRCDAALAFGPPQAARQLR